MWIILAVELDSQLFAVVFLNAELAAEQVRADGMVAVRASGVAALELHAESTGAKSWFAAIFAVFVVELVFYHHLGDVGVCKRPL